MCDSKLFYVLSQAIEYWKPFIKMFSWQSRLHSVFQKSIFGTEDREFEAIFLVALSYSVRLCKPLNFEGCLENTWVAKCRLHSVSWKSRRRYPSSMQTLSFSINHTIYTIVKSVLQVDYTVFCTYMIWQVIFSVNLFGYNDVCLASLL